MSRDIDDLRHPEWTAPKEAMSERYIDIVFDGPPAPDSGRFIEVEDETGKSISFGEWVQREDGYWALRITQPTPPASDVKAAEALDFIERHTRVLMPYTVREKAAATATLRTTIANLQAQRQAAEGLAQHILSRSDLDNGLKRDARRILDAYENKEES